ncbi:OpgC domain-containing protein [Candidatus Saccharibacteria bacterium]|nr:OpgC domain-containing protein [Candidatus Saccharibacteria bacterium]
MEKTVTTTRRQRILALDLLRGLFLVVIIVNHIAWSPSLFEFVTGKSALFASAAEGFFAISGILVGYIYGPKILEKTKHTVKRLWKRAGLLYALSIGLTLLFAASAYLLPEGSVRLPLWDRSLGSFLFNTFTLRHSFGWTDFLARYSLFMLLAPAVLWLIAKHKTALVGIASVLIWFFLRQNDLFLPFSAWQIIFVFGIMIGYHLPAIEQWFGSKSKAVRQQTYVSLSCLSLATFVFSMGLYIILPYLAANYTPLFSADFLASAATTRQTLAPYFSKEHLDLGRLLIGTLWFTNLYLVFRHHEQTLHKFTFGILEALGKRSLIVYVTHGFVIFAMDILFQPSEIHSLIVNTLVTGLTIFAIYRISLHYDQFRQLIVNRIQVPTAD